VSVDIKIEGTKELQRAMAFASVEAEKRVRKVVLKTGNALRKDVIRRVQKGPASGRTYKSKNPKRTHTASAPGEAPATDQGGLVESIYFNEVGPMTATVGSTAIYAAALEFGHSYGKGRVIEPRPYFTPAVEAMRETYMKDLEAALSETFK